MTRIPFPKIDKFSYFYHLSLSLNVTLSSKSPYLTAHIKVNFETGCIERFSGKKKYRCVYPGPW